MSTTTAFDSTPPVGGDVSGMRLRGPWLWVARLGWPLVVAISMIQFVQSLPAYRASIEYPSSDNPVLSPGAVVALAHAGITRDAYAWVALIVACTAVLISLAIACVLFWQRGDDWMALLVSLFVFVYTTSNVGAIENSPSSSPGITFQVALAALQIGIFYAITFGVCLLFPSGRFVPRWSWTIFVLASVWSVVIHVAPDLFGGILYLGYPLFLGAAIACMIYRYRQTSTPVQRLQTKWVVAGIVITLVANQAFWLPSGFTPLGQTIYPPLFYSIYQLSFLLLPMTFFIAIQRYRLYNIDTIINRAVVYGSLTALLATVYFGVVIGSQAITTALTHQTEPQPVIIVASTLLIAALFDPLRRRIQATIDRRFYRRKYDAAKTLAGFGATLRTETDLTHLTEHLVGVVAETMQPEHVSLWLSPEPRSAGGTR